MKEVIEFHHQGLPVLYIRKWDPDVNPQSKNLWPSLWGIHIIKASKNFNLIVLKVNGWWVSYTPEQINDMEETFQYLRNQGTLKEFKNNIIKLEAWLQKEGENFIAIGELIPND